ncbi:unnamed protein product [Trichobilharzia szidati]|nr:unnamed protein product [Trichobilharzia szidati]
MRNLKWKLFPVGKISTFSNMRIKQRYTINPSLTLNNLTASCSRASMKFKNYMVSNFKKTSLKQIIQSMKNISIQSKHFKPNQYSIKRYFKHESDLCDYKASTTYTTLDNTSIEEPFNKDIRKTTRLWISLQDSISLPYTTVSGMIQNRYKKLRDSSASICSENGAIINMEKLKAVFGRVENFPLGIRLMMRNVKHLRRMNSMSDNLMDQKSNEIYNESVNEKENKDECVNDLNNGNEDNFPDESG